MHPHTPPYFPRLSLGILGILGNIGMDRQPIIHLHSMLQISHTSPCSWLPLFWSLGALERGGTTLKTSRASIPPLLLLLLFFSSLLFTVTPLQPCIF